jgi:tRNA(fMet)-specific endonuclease VapC
VVRGSVVGSFAARSRGQTLNRLLLDTTFLIDAERAAREIDEAIDDADDVAIAAVTVAELRVGVLLASGRAAAARAAFVDDVLRSLPVVAYDANVAEAHAHLLAHARRTGRPRGAHDLLIAATAVATARAIVTADRRAFTDLPGLEMHPRPG